MKMKQIKSKFKLISIVLLCLISLNCFSLTPSDAAKLSFETKQPVQVSIGSEFKLDVTLDTEDQKLNAVEGLIAFPGDILELQDIQIGNSVINFWVEKPAVYKKVSDIFPQEIKFSGITPGGFSGKTIQLFSIVFKTKKEGTDEVKFQNFNAMLHDGKGTPVTVNKPAYSFNIVKNGVVTKVNEIKDTNAPDEFMIYLSRKSDVFNNKYFIAFSAQDKGSGIDYYEVHESTKEGSTNVEWVRGQSPYELKDQSLRSFVYVKAVDKAGNKRIEMLKPESLVPWEAKNQSVIALAKITVAALGILIVGVLVWIHLRKKVLRKQQC